MDDMPINGENASFMNRMKTTVSHVSMKLIEFNEILFFVKSSYSKFVSVLKIQPSPSK